MSDPQPRVRLIRKRKVRLYQGRGAVYSWLRAHHPSIEAKRASAPCLWAELVLDMIEDGVVDGNGDNPSAHNTRMTWKRVCRDLETEVPAPKPVGGKYPSRISPDWRPEIVSQSPSSPARPGSALAPASRPAWSPPAAAPNGRPSNPGGVAEPEIFLDANGVPYDEVGQARIREMQASVLGQLEKSDRGKFGP